MDFSCIDDCSQCCIDREYYPTKEFGKIGVLILPDEKERIESLAKKHGIKTRILPRIGVSASSEGPDEILAYQLMGIEENGNTCPFLDTESKDRSPHGGHLCKIYDDRPLACSAYPLIESKPIVLDEKCKFCKECGTATGSLDSEMESLSKIKSKMNTKAKFLWRYATGVGETQDCDKIKSGWIMES